MTDLTDKWKKGELSEGWYYIKVNDKLAKSPVITECVSDYNLSGKFIPDFYEYDDDKITEVLAPVPSYEEFQNLKEYEQTILSYNMKPIDYEIACETVNKLLDERKVLKEENAKLKELLKECKYELRGCYTDIGWEDQSLINKIDQALGEE